MFYSPKKSESHNSLLVDLLQQETRQTANQFKNNCLRLVEENITPEELAKLIGQKTANIIGFFWKKGIFIKIPYSILLSIFQETEDGGYYHMYVNTQDGQCCKAKVTIRAQTKPLIDSVCCSPGRCSNSNLCWIEFLDIKISVPICEACGWTFY